MERRLQKAVQERRTGLLKHYRTRDVTSWEPIHKQITHLYDRTRGVARSGKTAGDGRAMWGEDAMQFVNEVKLLYRNARALGARKAHIGSWIDLLDDGLRMKKEELIRGWVWEYDCPLVRKE